jgi:hypothetical protein
MICKETLWKLKVVGPFTYGKSRIDATRVEVSSKSER